MEWVEGRSVKDLLREWDVVQKRREGEEGAREREEDVRQLLRRVGRAVGAMHSRGGVVHGDLTSSNIMVRPVAEGKSNKDVGVTHEAGEEKNSEKVDLEGEIVLIDFGLAMQSIQDEDRAVDLYVLERAFGSTHPRQEGWFKEEVLESQEGYRGSFKGANVVLKRLEEVRMRGRKRSMVG
jgi:TP53 regulating kinase-like protein